MIDLINGAFAIASSGMATMNLLALYRDKAFTGVSIWPQIFFAVWGFWAAFLYGSNDLWASVVGTLASVFVTCTWIAMAVHYRRERAKHIAH